MKRLNQNGKKVDFVRSFEFLVFAAGFGEIRVAVGPHVLEGSVEVIHGDLFAVFK